MGKPAGENRSTIRAHFDFQQIYNHRSKLFRNGLTFYYRQSKSLSFKFAVAIPKRFGKAVERNKIRRRLRAIVRTAVMVPEYTHIIFTVNKPCAQLDYDSLRQACDWAFEKLSHTDFIKKAADAA